MGRVLRPYYTKPDGKGGRVRVQVKDWYAEWQVAGATRRKKIGTRAAATSALAKFEEAERLRRAGQADPAALAAERGRPLSELAREYLDELAVKDTSAEYRKNTEAQLVRVRGECGWHVWTDVTASSLLAFLGRLRDRPQKRAPRGAAKGKGGARATGARPIRSGRGCSPATLNGYIRTAKAFAKWCAARLDVASPLRNVKPYPEDVDRRRSKRILTDAELGKLLAFTETAAHKVNAEVRGAGRAWLYRLAAYTGLRAGELAELTPRHFALDASPPTVTVRARDAKGKREEPVPLAAHLVGPLREWLTRFAPTAKVFPGRWAERRHESRWLTWDLKRAGCPTHDEDGRPIHFHGLKRRYVVRLIQAGAKVHEVRRLARHVDVSTTLKHYTDENLKELGAVTDRLGPV